MISSAYPASPPQNRFEIAAIAVHIRQFNNGIASGSLLTLSSHRAFLLSRRLRLVDDIGDVQPYAEVSDKKGF